MGRARGGAVFAAVTLLLLCSLQGCGGVGGEVTDAGAAVAPKPADIPRLLKEADRATGRAYFEIVERICRAEGAKEEVERWLGRRRNLRQRLLGQAVLARLDPQQYGEIKAAFARARLEPPPDLDLLRDYEMLERHLITFVADREWRYRENVGAIISVELSHQEGSIAEVLFKYDELYVAEKVLAFRASRSREPSQPQRLDPKDWTPEERQSALRDLEILKSLALRALVLVGTEEAVQILEEVAKNAGESEATRREAVENLKRIGTDAAKAALRRIGEP